MTRLLLIPKLLAVKNSNTACSIIKRLPFFLIGAGVWALLYLGTDWLLSYLRSAEIFGEILPERLYSMTFFGLTGFMALSNVITALSSFYLSADISFWATKPVRIETLHGVKTIDTIITSSWMALSFITPILAAYGTNYNASPAYYLSVIATLLFFFLITAGAGILTAHLLTWLFPAKRSREALLGLGLVLFVALYFVVKSVIPADPQTPEELLQTFIDFRTESPYLPGYWVTMATLPVLKRTMPDFFYLMLLMSNSAFFLLTAAAIGKRLYRTNLEKLQPSGNTERTSFSVGYYPSGLAAMFFKDARLFFRDAGQWSQIFIVGALIIIYVLNFRSLPLDSLAALSPFMTEIMVFLNMLMAGLVLSAVAARFLYTAVSLEGRAFWIIRTAPVRIKKFLWSKFLYNATPLTFLMMLIMYLTNSAMHAGQTLMTVSLATTFMLCISVCGLGTGLGAIYPKFRHGNIASVSMSIGGMVFMIIAFCLVLSTLSLEAWAFYLLRMKGGNGVIASGTDAALIAAFTTVVLLMNLVSLFVPMIIGVKNLEKDAE